MGPGMKLPTTVLLNEHRNEETPNGIAIPIDQCVFKPSSEKLLLTVGGN